jgi:hypothetical protein
MLLQRGSTNHLATYLNDHLGGSTVGTRLARRIAQNNRSNEYGAVMEQVAREIEEDRETLLELMERLSVSQNQVKVATAWVTENATRLKLASLLTGSSELSRLEELETLSLGVAGKLSMWTALAPTVGSDERLRGIDLEELIKRARSQRQRIERLRRRAAVEAFT